MKNVLNLLSKTLFDRANMLLKLYICTYGWIIEGPTG